MNKQDTSKIGNIHSGLLDSMMKTAEKTALEATKKTPFSDLVIKIAENKQPTIREIVAQLEDELAAPLGDEPSMEEAPMEEDDDQDAKSAWANLGIALCGSVEEAHACLDEFAGPGDAPPAPEEGIMTPELEETPTDIAAPMEAAPMPAPMQMP